MLIPLLIMKEFCMAGAIMFWTIYTMKYLDGEDLPNTVLGASGACLLGNIFLTYTMYAVLLQ